MAIVLVRITNIDNASRCVDTGEKCCIPHNTMFLNCNGSTWFDYGLLFEFCISLYCASDERIFFCGFLEFQVIEVFFRITLDKLKFGWKKYAATLQKEKISITSEDFQHRYTF